MRGKMGKRKRVGNGSLASSSLKSGVDSERLLTTQIEQQESSPGDWLSSIQDHSSNPQDRLTPPEFEHKVHVDQNGTSALNDPANSEQTTGLKTSNFYGNKSPSCQFSLRKKSLHIKDNSIRKNGQHKEKTKTTKRKHKSPNSFRSKKAKRVRQNTQDEDKKDGNKNSSDDSVQHHESHVNGFIHDKNGKAESCISGKSYNTTILDIITPESSPTDSENNTTQTNINAKDLNQGLSQLKSVILNDKHADEHESPEDLFSELSSIKSEESLVSGHGSVKASVLIKGENGEYYFSNSNENSPDLIINGPSKFFNTPKSSQSSPCSEVSSLGIKERTAFLFGRESEGSSYSPSGNSSNTTSPEHQTSITKFFKSNSKQGSSVSSTKPKKPDRSKKSNKEKKMEQMYLDLGQRNFGHVTCTTCGMVYTHAQPDDEVEHIRHHKKFVNGLRFKGWKDEHVVKEFSDGRVIMIKPDDPFSHQKKAEEIRKVVDSELGFAVDLPYRKNESKTFLFIANKRVVGCCVATQIDKGYPVLPSTPNKDSTPDRQIAAWCCSTVAVPAQCGISKIWVWNQYRRRKVATRLIECVRTHFIYGCVISKDVLAFSDPTPDGKRLATAYIGTPEFLVFH